MTDQVWRNWQKTIAQEADELEISHELGLLLFNHNPQAMALVNSSGIIMLVNIQMEFLSGYHRSELKGKEIEILVPDESKEKHREYRDKYLEEPKFRPMGIGINTKILRKDGKVVPVEINLSPVPTPKGVIIITSVRAKY